MKKFLSFAFVSVLSIGATAQTLWEDNFESYDVGQLREQGGWVKISGRNRFVLVENIDADHGKSMRLAATGHVTGGGHMHSHEIGWANRDAGNNIFVFEYDYYNGTSANGSAFLEIYDTSAAGDDGETLLSVWDYDGKLALIYNDPVKYSDPTNEDPTSEVIVAPVLDNTWYHIKMSYNKDNGDINISVDGSTPTSITTLSNLNADGVVIRYRMTENAGFDNFVAKAVSTDPLLATSDPQLKSDISIFPNPVTDVINIKSGKEISNVSILDVSGKLVKQSKEKTINIENLSRGVYLIQINYLDGTKASKKIIKK